MAKQKKRKEKHINRLKIFLAVIIGIALLSYVIFTIYSLIKEPTNTFIIENGKIYLDEDAEGYIIREETIVKNENYTNGLEKIKNEGEKVARGAPVFRYYSKNESSLVKKINDLDLEIEQALQNDTTLFLSDVALLEKNINTKLRETNKINNIEQLNKLKNDINTDIINKAKIAGELSPAGSYIKKLIDKRNSYEAELNSNSEYINATASGIVSYKIDGFEDVLNVKNISKLDKKTLDKINIKAGQLIESSEQEAKVVNNFFCYIAIISNSEQAKEAKEGDKIGLQFLKSQEVLATLYKIVENDNNSRILIFKITNGVEELLEYRKVSVDVIWWSLNGLKVPTSAILKENGFNYIIRNMTGYKDKILVKVLKRNENYTIIDNYTSEELKNLGETATNLVSTKKVNLYDEILLNPLN